MTITPRRQTPPAHLRGSTPIQIMALVALVGIAGAPAVMNFDDASQERLSQTGSEMDLHGPFGGDGEPAASGFGLSHTVDVPYAGEWELSGELDVTDDGVVVGSGTARRTSGIDVGDGSEIDDIEFGVGRDASGDLSTRGTAGARGSVGGFDVDSDVTVVRSGSGTATTLGGSAMGSVGEYGVAADARGTRHGDGTWSGTAGATATGTSDTGTRELGARVNRERDGRWNGTASASETSMRGGVDSTRRAAVGRNDEGDWTGSASETRTEGDVTRTRNADLSRNADGSWSAGASETLAEGSATRTRNANIARDANGRLGVSAAETRSDGSTTSSRNAEFTRNADGTWSGTAGTSSETRDAEGNVSDASSVRVDRGADGSLGASASETRTADGVTEVRNGSITRDANGSTSVSGTSTRSEDGTTESRDFRLTRNSDGTWSGTLGGSTETVNEHGEVSESRSGRVSRGADGELSASGAVNDSIGGVDVDASGSVTRAPTGETTWNVSGEAEVGGATINADGTYSADGLALEATASTTVAEGVSFEVEGSLGTDGSFTASATNTTTVRVADGAEVTVVSSATLDGEGVSFEGRSHATYQINDDVKVHVEGSYDSEGNFSATAGGQVVVEVRGGEVTIAPEASVGEDGTVTVSVDGEAENVRVGGEPRSGRGNVTVTVQDGEADVQFSGERRESEGRGGEDAGTANEGS